MQALRVVLRSRAGALPSQPGGRGWSHRSLQPEHRASPRPRPPPRRARPRPGDRAQLCRCGPLPLRGSDGFVAPCTLAPGRVSPSLTRNRPAAVTAREGSGERRHGPVRCSGCSGQIANRAHEISTSYGNTGRRLGSSLKIRRATRSHSDPEPEPNGPSAQSEPVTSRITRQPRIARYPAIAASTARPLNSPVIHAAAATAAGTGPCPAPPPPTLADCPCASARAGPHPAAADDRIFRQYICIYILF
jgi:hypothetical protein